MAADELLARAFGDGGEGSGASLFEEQRQEVHLKEHVAELVQEL